MKNKELSKISKILVANRGEIAIRIMKTARLMNIKTVAVYSDADLNEKFLSYADEIFPLGGVLPRESYLEMDKIIDAAKKTGADAIHPGYGFLSEKHDFAKAVEDAGIIFIGPSSQSIYDMGDKISSKDLANKANVKTVPGSDGAVENFAEVEKVVKSIGYPVMIKASAGGGGKGIRIVDKKEDLKLSFESCVSEAVKNFKDGRVFVEKYIVKPRHIEVQILGDKYGNFVCLGERECSIQRFNQKIIEETPSAFVDDEMREKMYKNSINLAKACNYHSAGTVEFVVDKDKNFYFLEMNTRLQVEHGVTEMVTGYDLVEQMIRVARGEKLSFSQKDVRITGHSIECRICAEDPSNNFISSSGRISEYHEPKEGNGIRMESSCKKGTVITPYYDSMIGKLISYGDDRMDAIYRIRNALSRYIISGIDTNIFMLECIMRNGRFQSGDISTQFIKEEYSNGFVGMKANETTLKYFLAATALINELEVNQKINSFDDVKNVLDTMNIPEDEKTCVVIEDVQYVTNIEKINSNGNLYNTIITVNGKYRSSFSFIYDLGGKFIQVKQNNLESEEEDDDNFVLIKIKKRLVDSVIFSYDGVESLVSFYPVHIMHLLSYMKNKKRKLKPKNKIYSFMSGLVTNIYISEGQQVNKGDVIMSIEAMKMENSIISPCNGVVKVLSKKIGDVVSNGQLLVEIKTE